ncbi:MAG: hypothetical protein IPH20_17030 [Bacteroidales bacterium]|nr:hypothetical protein [Bacteroidales bacterium]
MLLPIVFMCLFFNYIH